MDKNILFKLTSLGCNIFREELLSKHCSFRIGGPADYFIEISNEEALSLFLKTINSDSFYVLGGGTNVLFSDDGYRGVVISLTGKLKEIVINREEIFCGGGALLSNVLNMAIKNNLIGLEIFSGIPGSVGGAVYGNAGSGDVWISSVIKKVGVYIGFKKKWLAKKQIYFSYRESSLENSIISDVCFSLKKTAENDSVATVFENVQRRIKTQPLSFPNAGSIFKNPKGFSAGKLIEETGLKGIRVGGAQISKVHGNFIVNTEEASAKDVLALISLIEEKIYKRFSIKLETEIKIIK
ncbi:MAG: UDP-N-acetylmuramate dehydrogenase [Endomicrobium sp.]|jgi:UDP-N-acetylmuramate dehydrogenase|nr:UDP-N-acetylmuramate dehydrogenase [Endomicrobium sp.]